jgi:hypothetical protein
MPRQRSDLLESDDLAARIEAEHAAVGQALRSALTHAIAAGELLSMAKRQVRKEKGKWLPWLAANCTVPARTASHYMALARRRAKLTDDNGNVLPISVREAIGALKHPLPPDGSGYSEWGEPARSRWGELSWGPPFSDALRAVTRIAQCRPPAPRYVVKAAKEGKTPGLTAPILRHAIMLLTRYADALQALEAPVCSTSTTSYQRVELLPGRPAGPRLKDVHPGGAEP